MKVIAADHDVTNREVALRFTEEKPDVMTVGVLYNVGRPSLLDQMKEIERKSHGTTGVPPVEQFLTAFKPAAA